MLQNDKFSTLYIVCGCDRCTSFQLEDRIYKYCRKLNVCNNAAKFLCQGNLTKRHLQMGACVLILNAI